MGACVRGTEGGRECAMIQVLCSLPLIIHIISQFHFIELFLFFLILFYCVPSALSLSLVQAFSLSPLLPLSLPDS